MNPWNFEPCMCGCDAAAESRQQPYAAGHEGRSYRRVLSWLANTGTLASEEAVLSQINAIKFLTPSAEVFAAKHWLEMLAEKLGIWHQRMVTDPEELVSRIEEESAHSGGNLRRFIQQFGSPEWRLISFPSRPATAAIASFFASTDVTEVWSLNNHTKAWEFARVEENRHPDGTLSTIGDGRSYFVRFSKPGIWSVPLAKLDEEVERSYYEVTTGWNGIGFTPLAGRESMRVDEYLSSLGDDGWEMIRMWKPDSADPLEGSSYETCLSDGWSTPNFPTNDEGIPILQAGVGYLLFATRNGVIRT